MAYDKYKVLRTIDEFYSTWTTEQLSKISNERKKEVYDEYAVKTILMQRDSFTCQNNNCQFCHNIPFYGDLTWHHIKFKKNGGKHTVRNGVIICESSHMAYNKGKHPLVFGDKPNLPPHIRKHTFWYDTGEKKFDYKENRIKYKKIRKDNKQYHHLVISWEMVLLLIKWLELDKYK